MSTLVCLGFGYSAQHYVAAYGRRYERIVGTTRSEANAQALASQRFGDSAVDMMLFDGSEASPQFTGAIAAASALLVSISPVAGADPSLARLHDAIMAAPFLTSIVYLSTIAVYGNHNGRWIDEATPLAPILARAGERIDAENAWQAAGAARDIPVAIIRVAGVYGPGQNALETLKAGRARRITKPGQVFNRIHVADLAQIIEMAFLRRAGGIFNAADDEPTAPGDPIVFAAGLLGIAPPAEITFEEAREAMSSFAISLYGESKRVRNARIKSVLGVSLRYPTYREGLRALAQHSAKG